MLEELNDKELIFRNTRYFILSVMSQTKKGREYIVQNKMLQLDDVLNQKTEDDPLLLEIAILKFSALAKLVCDQNLENSVDFPEKKMAVVFQQFLQILTHFVQKMKQGYLKEPVFV